MGDHLVSVQRKLYVEIFGGPDVPLTRAMRLRLTLAIIASVVSGTIMAGVIYGLLLVTVFIFDAVTR